MRKMNRIVF